MRTMAVWLTTFALTSVSFAQTTIYWTGNEDRWGGGSQTGTANDNFSTTPGGTTYEKVSDGGRYDHVYDRSPAGLMAGANYGVSINRQNNIVDSITLVGDGGLGFTFDTVAGKTNTLNGNITASGGTHVFNNVGGISMLMGDSPTIDVAADSQLLWQIPLTPDSATVRSVTKTGDGILAITGVYDYTGTTAVNGGAFGVFGGNGMLAGDLTLAAGTKLLFSDAYTLTLASGTATFSHTSFGIGDLVGLDSSVAEGTYNLIAGTVAGTFGNLGLANAADIGGGKKAYLELGSLNLVVVPEPSTFALAALGLAGILIFGRRIRV